MKAARVVICSVLAVFAWTPLHAQSVPAQPPRDLAAPSPGTGVVSGTVVSDEPQPRPVRHARVTIANMEASFARTTSTDDEGRFTFRDLPAAARYAVSAAKETWVTTAYGARRPQRPGTPVLVADGARVTMTIRLLHGAVITGLVADQNGQPEGNVLVRAMRYAFQNGERKLLPAGYGITDDRGVYRIWGLAPGDYLISGRSRLVSPTSGAGELHLTTDLDVRRALSDVPQPPPQDRTVSMSPIYYPGTAIASQAGLVSVRAAEERSGVDIALQITPAVRVEGSVASAAEPSAVSGAQLSLIVNARNAIADPTFDFLRSTRPAADGSFAFVNVTPGPYTVLARSVVRPPDGSPAGTPPRVLWAAADVAVEGDDLSGLSLMLEPAMTLSGRVTFDGTTLAPPANLEATRVTLQPQQAPGGLSMAPSAALMHPDGRFTVSGVTPGMYRLFASLPGTAGASRWALRSSVINGQDTLDVPITVQAGQPLSEATITFTDHLAELTGSLRSGLGAAAPDYTIILFAPEQSTWLPQSRRIQTVRPSADGAFTFRNLPAGNYLLAAVEDVEPGEWFDPSFLQRLQTTAMRVTIGDGEKKVQDVRVGGSH